ncbi:MAG: hypothetical protein KAX78_12780, partial [Phycisphaerae bacterium]|nr:hypothetical protein [Phycisphaerae bacterium]
LRQRQDDQTAFDVERAIEDRKKCSRASNMLQKLGDRIDQACDCDCQQPPADADDDAGQCECDCECDPTNNDCCR